MREVSKKSEYAAQSNNNSPRHPEKKTRQKGEKRLQNILDAMMEEFLADLEQDYLQNNK